MNGLLGKKVGMTQFFTEDGERVPVTVVQSGPVTVIQKKTVEKDGYQAVQVGFEEVVKSKEKNITKPLKGHYKDQKPTKLLREFKVENIDEIEVGQTFDVSLFEKGEIVDVSGTSKGRGFTGVMKRHNFSGGPAAHGHRFNRGTGAIGQSATPAKIFKNKKMPGQYGNVRATTQGLEIVDINKDLNVLLIKGAIPGPNGRFVEVRRTTKGK
ncbi:MAG: 50S ribosomal protein L3 [Proteobacteria bacterium]|nr:50S ribosomal protein L3 [Pseudomonadota bacterium]